MSKRKKASAQRSMPYPVAVEQSPHEKKLSEMHDALYSLGNKVRAPMGDASGEKLLPAALRSAGMHATTAKAHIDALHAHFKAASKEQ